MAGQWVDPDGEITLDENEEMGNLDEMQAEKPTEESQKEQEVETQSSASDEEEELPEKYRGKSKAEIARMHREIEQAYGRQSGEVGELRKVFDDYIKQQAAQKAPETKEEPADPVDFFVDPERAVREAIKSAPEVKQMQETAKQMAQRAAREALEQKHPDVKDIMADPAFADWLKGSNYRLGLARKADAYDFDAADELFSLWKERKEVVSNAKEIEKKAQDHEIKKASTGTGRSNPEGSGKKIYRRADIIRLMREDPKRYEDLQDDIMKAYADGRVR